MLTRTDGTITASLTPTLTVTGALVSEVGITGSIAPEVGMTGELGLGGGEDYASYQGDYTVTPAVEAQTLDTRRKVMTEDVRVGQIPYYETTNESGGYTVIIA